MTGRYTVEDALHALIEHDLSWPGRSPFFFMTSHGRAPARINAPFLYVLGAELWAEELSRHEWLEDVRSRLGLVTIDGGMPRERRDPRATVFLLDGAPYEVPELVECMKLADLITERLGSE